MTKYFLICSIFFSGLFSLESGYYIYKFRIDNKDNIYLEDSNYIDEKLKISKVKKNIHDPFLYQVKTNQDKILFEGSLQNPKTIYFEDILNDNSVKHIANLDNTYFVIKIPAFDNMEYIQFYNSKDNYVILKENQVKLEDNHNDRLREIFPVSDIMVNGANDSRVNIVFLGDGYKQNQMEDYISDVEDVVDGLFNTIPYANYMNYFNVYAVEVPSDDSGTDHPGTAPDCGGYSNDVFYADTYFDSSFDLYDIHRLLYIQNSSAAFDVLTDNLPQWDIIFVMVNTTMYGGAGGTFAVFSRHQSSTEIAIHEIGHSFAGLSDEYWAGFNYAGENANMTENNNPETIIWNPWLYDNGIGIYPYESPGNEWFRPHQNCKMQFLGPPFCSVCAEQTVRAVYGVLEPIDTYYPYELELDIFPSDVISFSIEPILPSPSNLDINWFIDNHLIEQDIINIEIEASNYSLGEHEVKVVLNDLTDLVRNDPLDLLKSEITWNLIINCTTNPDINSDGDINIQDVIIIVNSILEGSPDFPCIDLNQDEILNILDIIVIINIILE
jgi:hypothetical protein